MAERSKEVEWIFSVLEEATIDLKSLCLLTPAAMTPNLKESIGPETAFLIQVCVSTIPTPLKQFIAIV
jgi:hypothetical protein